MTRTVDAIYKNNVLKHIDPIESIKEHERAAVMLCLFAQDGHFDHNSWFRGY